MRKTYLCIAMITAILILGVALFAFLHLIGLSIATPFHQLSIEIKIGFLSVLFISLPGGFLVGGWVWGHIAKRFLGVTKAEMELLFFSGDRTQFQWLENINRKVIESVYS